MSERNKPDSPPGQNKPKPGDPSVSNPIYDPPGQSGGSPPHGGSGGGGDQEEIEQEEEKARKRLGLRPDQSLPEHERQRIRDKIKNRPQVDNELPASQQPPGAQPKQ